jgi:hypothetical protein
MIGPSGWNWQWSSSRIDQDNQDKKNDGSSNFLWAWELLSWFDYKMKFSYNSNLIKELSF